MFFILSKTAGFFAVPSNALSALALVGAVLLLTRWRRSGRRILMVCLVLFLAVGLFPIGEAMRGALEQRFPPWTETAGPPDGIIVLGGPIRIGQSERRGVVAIGHGAERFTVVPSLAKKYPNARIVFSGGNPRLAGEGTPEAKFAVPLLESFGIAPERIAAEDRSRNTAENAVFTRELVNPKPGERWLLITSAAHMPRAVGAFRQAGFPVEPYPVDYNARNASWRAWLLPGLSPLGGWNAIDDAAKEYVGLLAYWLTGRTSGLFPGPVTP
jgi:uncharacterized SAM-binding protein YcdF (DUF218 family)